MADGFEVLSGELETHATRISGFADRLGAAADAANQVAMNDSAFGVVCQPFAMILNPFEQQGVQALRQAVESMGEVGRKVKDTAKSYDQTEQAETRSYENLEGEL
jgi:hypothetical protein